MLSSHSPACSEQADYTLATQLLWCMKCNTKYNLTSRPSAQQSGSLQTRKPTSAVSVCVRRCRASRLLCLSVLQRACDIGDERFGIESQGESSLSSRPPPSEESRLPPSPHRQHQRLQLCSPIYRPIPSNVAAATANLHDSGPAAADLAVFPDGISSDITFGIPRSSQAGHFPPSPPPAPSPCILNVDARRVHSRSMESLPSAPCTLMEGGPLIMS